MIVVLYSADGHKAVWLQAKVRERGLRLRPRLNGGHVCDAQRCWSSICGLLRYMSAKPLPFSYKLRQAKSHGEKKCLDVLRGVSVARPSVFIGYSH